MCIRDRFKTEPERNLKGSTAQLAMATIFASGGYHLLLGEEGSVLTEAYYPDNCRIGEHSFRKTLKKYYDFITAYGGLLFPESWTDLTMQYAGGIKMCIRDRDYIYRRAFNYFDFGYAAACGIVMGIVVFAISMGLKRFLRYGENL